MGVLQVVTCSTLDDMTGNTLHFKCETLQKRCDRYSTEACVVVSEEKTTICILTSDTKVMACYQAYACMQWGLQIQRSDELYHVTARAASRPGRNCTQLWQPRRCSGPGSQDQRHTCVHCPANRCATGIHTMAISQKDIAGHTRRKHQCQHKVHVPRQDGRWSTVPLCCAKAPKAPPRKQ